MANRSSRKEFQTANQAAELAFAVPQVMAHRFTRMAFAGPNPSAHDIREFNLMWTEKMTTFYASWSAMLAATVEAQQKATVSMMQAFWAPWSFMDVSKTTLPLLFWQQTAFDVFSKGMAPLHETAVANAKRLSR